MKTMIAAMALTIAVPAYAQTAPAADPHAGHTGHQMPAKQGEHDCKDCCEKMKGKDGKMECMDKKGDAKSAAQTGQHDHSGHKH